LLRTNPYIWIQSFEIDGVCTCIQFTFLSENISIFSHIHFSVILYLALKSARNFSQQLCITIHGLGLWPFDLALGTAIQAEQVTINKTAALLCNGSAVLRTEWVHHVISFTYETQLSGSAKTRSKDCQLILFQSLYRVFRVSYSYSHISREWRY
jgi:hypothetical protein